LRSGRHLQETVDLIRTVYLQDNRPWVIGFSGGKDSTCTLQLVWYALAGLSREQLSKPIYVISSNTLVESPAIVSYIRKSIDSIGSSADAAGLPISAQMVQPLVNDSFWVNLIGRGYPAPSTKFRWCTDRLKIQPANRFILDQVARFGEVILVLGVRSAESATRAQVMAMHQIEGSPLRTHRSLLGALVYAPIADWSTEDVWNYLLQNAETPWHSDNNDLAAMYRTADGECPLVVDTSTTSCGNSRFGCWVCTVVTRDKAMESMIDGGQWWMEELLKLRDFLAETQAPERRREVRSVRKLNGQILLKGATNEASPGPYTFEFCKEILEKVLTVQRNLPPDVAETFELISEAELLAIRSLWLSQRHDWEDSLPKIYESALGKRWLLSLDARQDNTEDARLTDDIAATFGIPALLLRKLIDTERKSQGLRRRSKIFSELDAVLNRDWRDDDILAADLAKIGS
jgi:DNA sulfur modification protein DndC